MDIKGFLPPSTRAALAETMASADKSRRTLESLVDPGDGFVWAKLTSRDTTTGFYAWTHQAFDTDSGFYDHPNGMTGSATWMPARSLNDEVVQTTPNCYCLLKRAIVDPDTGPNFYIVSTVFAPVEIVQTMSRTTPPTGFSDARIVYFQPASNTFTAGVDIWLKDANG